MRKERILAIVLSFLIIAGTVYSSQAHSRRVELIRITPKPDVPTKKMYFQSTAGEEELLAFREALKERGAWHIFCFLPDLIVCDVPENVNVKALLKNTRILAHDPSSIRSFERGDAPYTISWLKHLVDRAKEIPVQVHPQDPSALAGESAPPVEITRPLIVPRETVLKSMAPRDGTPPSQKRNDAEEGPAEAFERNIHQNSEIMLGTVLINMIFAEGWYSWRNWSDENISNAIGGATMAMITYTDRYNRYPLDVIIHTVKRADTAYEPIMSNIDTDYRWVRDVIWRLGFGGGLTDHFLVVHEYNKRLRNRYQADWVSTAFIADAWYARNHSFYNARYIGYAYLGGPYFVLPYPAGDYNPWNLDYMTHFGGVFLRELLKTFWALYEYQPNDGCDEYSGYLNYRNWNGVLGVDPYFGIYDGCEDHVVDWCVMALKEAVTDVDRPICEYTEGMIGVVDKDENSIPDIFDAEPYVEYEHPEPETLLYVGEGLDINFTSISGAVPNKNPYQLPEERIDYAIPLNWGAYTADALGPVQLMPLDGKWDEEREECSVYRQPTIPGYHEVVVTLRNDAGVLSSPQRKIFYILGLRFSAFTVEHKNDGLRLSWHMIGDMFNGKFSLHRIDMESMPRDTMTVENLEPSGPPSGNHMPFTFFDDTVIASRAYRYFIKGIVKARVEQSESTFVYYSPILDVVASAPITAGTFLSDPAPNPFREITHISVNVPPTYAKPDFPGDIQKRIATDVSLVVFDVLGRKVKTLYAGGAYDDVLTVTWDGTNDSNQRVPSGVYFLNAASGDFTGVKKMVLTR